MHSFGFVLLQLLAIGMLAVGQVIAADPEAIAEKDSRFRALQPTESGFKPKVMPTGMAGNELTLWQHRIGSDDTPALLVAINRDASRLWITARRDDAWIEVAKIDSTSQWASTIKAQAPASRTSLWPTPDSIDIRLRQEPTTGLWMIAALVEQDGRFDLNGQTTNYRLRDENSDGKLDSVDDSLQVDLNGNGQFDKLRERFPLTKFFRHQDARYAIKLDRTARTVGVESFDTTGTVELTFDGWEGLEQPPTRVHVAMQSESGIQAIFSDMQPQALPPGQYYVYSALLNWDGDEKWRMAFASWDSQSTKFKVEAGQTTKIPVLGKAELKAEVESYTFADNAWRVTIQPVFKSETGLYLTRSSSGSITPSIDGTLIATVQAASDARTLTTGATQFACGTFCPISMSWKDETAAQIKLSFDSGPLAGVMTSQVKLERK